MRTSRPACRLYLPICATGLDPQNGPGPTDIGTFNTISGTSMAAPHIAGVVAQLFQANPSATPAQVEDALKTTAHKFSNGAAYEAGALGTTSFDKGYGLVDVVASAAACASPGDPNPRRAREGNRKLGAVDSDGAELSGFRMPCRAVIRSSSTVTKMTPSTPSGLFATIASSPLTVRSTKG